MLDLLRQFERLQKHKHVWKWGHNSQGQMPRRHPQGYHILSEQDHEWMDEHPHLSERECARTLECSREAVRRYRESKR